MQGRSLGIITLSIWLILTGVLAITNLQFALAVPIMAVLAITAGILLLFGR